MSRPVVTELFSLLTQYGVKHIVCSPGSRNAALLMGASRCTGIKNHVVIDERSAAFIALGIASVSQSPVALICTSGSALLNYSPAIAEAYYQGIPLFVISADRQLEWIDQDDSQTIRQYGALSNITKGSYSLNADSEEVTYKWYSNRILNEALTLMLKRKQGPVHLNLHLDGHVSSSLPAPVTARKIDTVRPPQRLEKEEIRKLAELCSNKKVMITVGFLPPDNRLQKAFSILSSLPNVCIMSETVSNLHLEKENYMIDVPLFKIKENERERLAPDIVISVGGSLISRKLKEYLRKCRPLQNWYVGYSHNVIDCFQSVTKHLECDSASFLHSLAKRIKKIMEKTEDMPSDYNREWFEFRKQTTRPIDHVGWSDLKALTLVFKALPQESNLFLSNGTSVRYAQIIPHRLPHATYSNRGVSGIEGSLSTAIGGASVYKGLSVLITGDMSLSYDIPGLSSGLITENLRIIVIDNGGGDIFRFINATKDLSIREKFLTADPKVPVENLARAFGLKYYSASSQEILDNLLPDFFACTGKPKILHIVTRNSDNSMILREFLQN